MKLLNKQQLIESLGVAPEDSETIVENIGEMMELSQKEVQELIDSVEDDIEEIVLNSSTRDKDLIEAIAFTLEKVHSPSKVLPKLYYIVREFIKDEEKAWCAAGFFYGETKHFLNDYMKVCVRQLISASVINKSINN